jgi:threonylcarbamoyladenosine tRNA methylthiotransferase MtaB
LTLSVITFGCRLNAAESEAMRASASQAGLDDTILINTCAVTAEAVRQARQAIRRARRESPTARIVVSGCAAQIEPETFAAMDEVDLVLGNAEKLSAGSYSAIDFGMAATERIRVNDIFSVRETAWHMIESDAGTSSSLPHAEVLYSAPSRLAALAPQGEGGIEPRSTHERVRAFVEVQNGCDHRCTFCIIPYGRGNSRSVPAGAVVSQVRRLAERGVAEVVLTGVDITAWGLDLPGRPRLSSLVRAVLKHVPDLPRLRLSSLDSVEVDDELFRLLGDEERLMPHLHLSLQAGDDMILKRMKRRHSRAGAIRFSEQVREIRPEVVLGADLIAGFPTETDAMFENTCRLIEDCGLSLLHVFPFSPRPGTPAARMPQLPRSVVWTRAKILRDAGQRALAARLAAEVNKSREVLVEKAGFGRSEHYLPVMIDGGEPGEVVTARIACAKSNMLQAKLDRELA